MYVCMYICMYVQGVAVSDRTNFSIYASKYYGVSLT